MCFATSALGWVRREGRAKGGTRQSTHLMGILNSCWAAARKRLRASWGW